MLISIFSSCRSMNHHFVEIGMSFALLAIIVTHLTTAAPSPYVESDMAHSLNKYKQQLMNALRKRSDDDEATNQVLTASARHFISSAFHKKRSGLSAQKKRDLDLAGRDDDASKRRGAWYYDYGLGGGRFGKRKDYGYTDDYGIGGGRFGRDVDHVDLLDA
ncbi:unnamed protein product [Acanthosepion pharaonis]|uniref:Uncharacterized protein n=1 Tax=Acanthosepion pharaonis TaxID=158019 RepID=A0A812DF03_ACAPH|nr:unnamed protein product [Sepia pharaonis]